MKMKMKRRYVWQALGLTAALAFAAVAASSTASAQSADNQFTTTANPVALNVPIQTPKVKPVVVNVLASHSFGNAPSPATTTVALPKGHWSKVVLKVTGMEKGRQFDRLLQIFAGNTQILNSVTPEPTPQGITWHVQKDVTQYLPLLKGSQTFTTTIDNYTSSVYTGVPKVSVTLEFYPARGMEAKPTTPWRLPVPSQIVPLQSSPNEAYLPSGSWKGTVTLPRDITGAYLDLNATAQIGEEFWWGNNPAFRQIDVSIDGKPAGVVWPYPYIYTGGVNPYMWRPITAVHTLDMPTYRIDLSPFAGMLGGKHTITLSVEGNTGYWLLNSSLFLYEDGGKPTSGSISKDTLKFPAQPMYSTQNALDSKNNPLVNETSNQNYEIVGTLKTARGTWKPAVKGSVVWSNDQTLVGSQWQIVHGAQQVSTDESMTNPRGHTITRQSSDSYTLDATDGFLQPSSGNGFFLPTDVTQSLNQVHTVTGLGNNSYNSSLYESVQGYGALQEGVSSGNITQGATTGILQYNNSLGREFRETLMARGGTLSENQKESVAGHPWRPTLDGWGLPGWLGMSGEKGETAKTLTRKQKHMNLPLVGQPGVKEGQSKQAVRDRIFQ